MKRRASASKYYSDRGGHDHAKRVVPKGKGKGKALPLLTGNPPHTDPTRPDVSTPLLIEHPATRAPTPHCKVPHARTQQVVTVVGVFFQGGCGRCGSLLGAWA